MTEIKNITVGEHPYLSPLTHHLGMPSSLFVKGSLPGRQLPTVAIIGSRRPTSYGKEITFELAYKLAQRGVTIVSGLAFGIDAIAHQAALEAGGTTIAIQANGLDRIYPASHHQLAHRIIENRGALLSEYPPGTPPRAHLFLERNRLISGLADIVIVTESTERSGTVSTVNHALEQGREVYAVPGPITSLLSAGPNKLIQQGAAPLNNIQEFVDSIAKPAPSHPLVILIKEGIDTDEALLQKSNLTASDLSSQLTLLEIDQLIQRDSQQRWRVITP